MRENPHGTRRADSRIWLGLVLLMILGGCAAKTDEHRFEEMRTALVAFQDGDLWGFRSLDGSVAIPARYLVALDFNRHGIAAVADRTGWWIIDSRGRKLLKPFLFDNGPDPFRESMARFVEKGLIGYFDERGKVVIAPRFSGAEPFHDGRARVCMDCRSEAEGEHSRWVGGTWFYIDTKGNRLP